MDSAAGKDHITEDEEEDMVVTTDVRRRARDQDLDLDLLILWAQKARRLMEKPAHQAKRVTEAHVDLVNTVTERERDIVTVEVEDTEADPDLLLLRALKERSLMERFTEDLVDLESEAMVIHTEDHIHMALDSAQEAAEADGDTMDAEDTQLEAWEVHEDQDQWVLST